MNEFINMCISRMRNGLVTFNGRQSMVYKGGEEYHIGGAPATEEDVRDELRNYYKANDDAYIEDKTYLEERMRQDAYHFEQRLVSV